LRKTNVAYYTYIIVWHGESPPFTWEERAWGGLCPPRNPTSIGREGLGRAVPSPKPHFDGKGLGEGTALPKNPNPLHLKRPNLF
jgi:hypothetical protein